MFYLRSFNRFILISLTLLGFLFSGSVQAAIFSVLTGVNDIGGANTPIAPEAGIAEGATAASTLIADALVTSALVKAASEADTIAALGFDFIPVPSNAAASASLDILNFSGFGSTVAYLSQDSVIDGGDAMATITAAGDNILLGALFGASPFYVIFDWTNTTDGGAMAFTVAVTQLSPVPIPAAIWLFGTAMIGLVGFGRRKSKVAL